MSLEDAIQQEPLADDERRVTIRLSKATPEEGRILEFYDNMRPGRRQEWIRRLLVLGFNLSSHPAVEAAAIVPIPAPPMGPNAGMGALKSERPGRAVLGNLMGDES